MDVQTSQSYEVSDPTRWYVLFFACVGLFMTVLDSTIVNVALPMLGADLGFSESSLVWVVNGYMVPFSGFLPLSGRLGDYYGYRRVFLLGVGLFCVASLGCGLASSATMLVSARVVQGIAAAVISAVSVPFAMRQFRVTSERARALGVLGCVSGAGSSIGLVLGGILTTDISWRWIFLVNIPLGLLVFAFRSAFRTVGYGRRTRRLDIGGAVTITTALLLAVFSILGLAESGWRSVRVLLPMGIGIPCLFLFLAFEARACEPVLPVGLFRVGNFSAGVLIGALWTAAQLAWFFLCTLYLQRVLLYSPLQVGLAFLPSNLLLAVLLLKVSASLIQRYGIRWPLVLGLLLIAAGLALFSRAPVNGTFLVDVLPPMVLLGLGCGVASGPFLLAALAGIRDMDYGVAFGVLKSCTVMGAALSLAILASMTATHTRRLLDETVSLPAALNSGYHLAFGVSAAMTCVAAVIALKFLRFDKGKESETA